MSKKELENEITCRTKRVRTNVSKLKRYIKLLSTGIDEIESVSLGTKHVANIYGDRLSWIYRRIQKLKSDLKYKT